MPIDTVNGRIFDTQRISQRLSDVICPRLDLPERGHGALKIQVIEQDWCLPERYQSVAVCLCELHFPQSGALNPFPWHRSLPFMHFVLSAWLKGGAEI